MNNYNWCIFVFLILAASGVLERRRRPSAAWYWVLLPEGKFWSVVAREERPLALLTTKGFLRKRVCYLYPYRGFMFYTWSRLEEIPEGVTLVPTLEELER